MLHLVPTLRFAREDKIYAAICLSLTDSVLDRRPMFSEITKDGIRWLDGTTLRANVIFCCTGFRSSLDHLAPLMLRHEGGGIAVAGLWRQVTKVQRVHLGDLGATAPPHRPSAPIARVEPPHRSSPHFLPNIVPAWRIATSVGVIILRRISPVSQSTRRAADHHRLGQRMTLRRLLVTEYGY